MRLFRGVDLTYNVVEQTLKGKIGKTAVSAHAVSGGRAGSKKANATNNFLANNPFSSGVKKKGNIPGGAIPLARFELRLHESRANWIRLVPLKGENLHGRDGFAIHGRGQRGSDGCIVPTDFHNVLLLCSLVKTQHEHGMPAPILEVVAIGDLSRFEKLRQLA